MEMDHVAFIDGKHDLEILALLLLQARRSMADPWFFSGMALSLRALFCSIFPSLTIEPKERTKGNY
jgi:hypothetical protein